MCNKKVGELMRYHSRSDLESMADQIIQRYKSMPRFADQTISCIDPVALACELYGLKLDHYRLSADDMVLGLTADAEIEVEVQADDGTIFPYQLDGNTILVASSLKASPEKRGRYHFTILHEVAHLILSRIYPEKQAGLQGRILRYRAGNAACKDWTEWQADTLAAALLLPLEMVEQALCHFGLREEMTDLPRQKWPLPAERIADMAKYLGASKQALIIRLKQLGLFRPEFIRDDRPRYLVVKEEGEEW